MNRFVAYSTVNRGRPAFDYRREDLQAIPADAVFYVQRVRSRSWSRPATARKRWPPSRARANCSGKGWLIGQSLRLATARAMVESEVIRIGKAELIRVLQAEPSFGELFITHLLTRASRAEEGLADQLFSPTEKRLA
jgi:CRP/FNR family transcriptional regulator, cyclic AMP receptor protein